MQQISQFEKILIENKLVQSQAISSPKAAEGLHEQVESLSLNQIQSRSFEKAMRAKEKHLSENGINAISESEREELKDELKKLDMAGEAWKPSGINKNIPSPPKYTDTVMPARKNVMFTDDGEMVVIEKRGGGSKRGQQETPKVMNVAASNGNSVPVHTPRSVRTSAIPTLSKTPPRPPAAAASSSSSTVKPNTVYALTPLSTPVQSNRVASPGKTPTTKTPGSVGGVIDKLDRMASILESQFKLFQSQQEQQRQEQQQQQFNNKGVHAHMGPIRKGDECGPSPTSTSTSRRHLHPHSSAPLSLPATPLMSPLVAARGTPFQQQPQQQQQQQQQPMGLTPKIEEQFEMANGLSFSQFLAEFNDLKQQVLAQTPAKGHREGGSSLLPSSNKQKIKYLEERRQAGQKVKVTSSVSRKALDHKSENSEADDMNNKPWYHRRAYAKSNIDAVQDSNSPSKDLSKGKYENNGNGNENRIGSEIRDKSPPLQRQAPSNSIQLSQETQSSSDDMKEMLSIKPFSLGTLSQIPSFGPESSTTASSMHTGIQDRRVIPIGLPHGVTEIPTKHSLSSIGNGKGTSSSRQGDENEKSGNNPSSAQAIESLQAKLEEMRKQLEDVERTELFAGDTGKS